GSFQGRKGKPSPSTLLYRPARVSSTAPRRCKARRTKSPRWGTVSGPCPSSRPEVSLRKPRRPSVNRGARSRDRAPTRPARVSSTAPRRGKARRTNCDASLCGDRRCWVTSLEALELLPIVRPFRILFDALLHLGNGSLLLPTLEQYLSECI